MGSKSILPYYLFDSLLGEEAKFDCFQELLSAITQTVGPSRLLKETHYRSASAIEPNKIRAVHGRLFINRRPFGNYLSEKDFFKCQSIKYSHLIVGDRVTGVVVNSLIDQESFDWFCKERGFYKGWLFNYLLKQSDMSKSQSNFALRFQELSARFEGDPRNLWDKKALWPY